MRGEARLLKSAFTLRSADWLREAMVVVAVYLAYSAVRFLANDATAALAHAEEIVRWQREWGLYWERHIQAWTLDRLAMTHIANTVYFWFHLPLLIVFALWMFLANRQTFRLLRNVWVITQVIGVLLYYLYPVAPPRLLPASYGFVDTMAQLSPVNYTTAEAGPLMNQYAAFPSLHFAWSVIIAVGLYHTLPWRPAKALSILFPLASLWSILATGNHYLADAIVGGAVVAVAFLLVVAAQRLPGRHPAIRPPPTA